MVDFRVDLNVFRGPLDLLLYLVRKHEVEIVDIPIAAITDQYLEYLAVIEQLDVNAVGDFLAMASLLIEIKSQQVLPRGDEVEEEMEDPRQELVRRLLEYKKYRDAASILEERSRQWQQRYSAAGERPAPARAEPGRRADPGGGAVGPGQRVRPDHARDRAARPSSIVYDDTPIHVYMGRIHARLAEAGRLAFRDLFEPGMHKSTLVGIFLAALELVRHATSPRGAERPVRRDLDPGPTGRLPARWICPTSDKYEARAPADEP